MCVCVIRAGYVVGFLCLLLCTGLCIACMGCDACVCISSFIYVTTKELESSLLFHYVALQGGNAVTTD